MSGYPHPQAGYGYGQPQQPQQPQPYGSAAPYSSPYGAQPQPAAPYGTAPQPAAAYGAAQPAAPYGHPYGAPAPAPGTKPPKDKPQASAPGGYPSAPYGSSPFASLMPSTSLALHLPSRDRPKHRRLLSSRRSGRAKGIRSTVLQFAELESKLLETLNWRTNFERFDRDRSGKIDPNELREALMSLGFAVSPVVLDLLVSKFDKTGGKNKAIEYDNFIECCLTVKGLTDKFKERDTAYSGSASFTYENFMLTVLPFLIA
uniref:CAML1 n=1 Tax=Populus tomentosa TaxID=118781 RepID=R4UBG4_POPTO|nr:CAML1 [Populus tomentosa]